MIATSSSHPSSPWPIRAAIFDLDGLLIDTEPIFEETARRLLRRRGLELSREVAQAMMGTPAQQALPILCAHYHLTEKIEALGAESRQLFLEILGTEPVGLMPGALELLHRLESKGIPRALATSSSAAYIQHVLQPHPLREHFAFVLTCEDVKLGKPYPEVYEKAAARFGCRPADTVVFEDSVNGMRAAKRAGARCIVVPHALVPTAELTEADLIVPSLDDPRINRLLGLDM